LSSHFPAPVPLVFALLVINARNCTLVCLYIYSKMRTA
jgi:hypothetical protein